MLYNATQIIGLVIDGYTGNITGSLYLTLLLILLFIIAITMYFGIPIEITGIAILPLILVLMYASNNFVGIGTAILFYISLIMIKYLFIFR